MDSASAQINLTFRWQFLSSVFVTILQLTALVLLGRYLDFRELGAYALFQIIFRFALYVFEPGMFFSLVQRHEYGTPLVNTLIRKQVIILLISLALLGGLFFLDLNDDLRTIILPGIVLMLVIGLGALPHSKLILMARQREIAWIQAVSYLAEFIWIISAIKLADRALPIFISLLIRYIFYYGLCFLVSLRTEMRIPQAEIADIPTRHIKPSRDQVLSQLLSFLQGQYDTLLITGLFGMNVLGPYNLATEYSYLAFSKINPLFHKATFPFLSKTIRLGGDSVSIVRNNLSSYLLVMLSVYILLWPHREGLLSLAYLEKSTELARMAAFILVVALIKAVNNILTGYLLAYGAASWVLKWNLVLTIVNYLVCGIFWWIQIKLEVFLIFSIVYSLIFMFAGAYFLQKFCMKGNSILDFNILSVMLCVLPIWIACFSIEHFVTHPLWSVFLSGLATLFLIFVFQKQRLLDLLHLKIMR